MYFVNFEQTESVKLYCPWKINDNTITLRQIFIGIKKTTAGRSGVTVQNTWNCFDPFILYYQYGNQHKYVQLFLRGMPAHAYNYIAKRYNLNLCSAFCQYACCFDEYLLIEAGDNESLVPSNNGPVTCDDTAIDSLVDKGIKQRLHLIRYLKQQFPFDYLTLREIPYDYPHGEVLSGENFKPHGVFFLQYFDRLFAGEPMTTCELGLTTRKCGAILLDFPNVTPPSKCRGRCISIPETLLKDSHTILELIRHVYEKDNSGTRLQFKNVLSRQLALLKTSFIIPTPLKYFHCTANIPLSQIAVIIFTSQLYYSPQLCI